MVIVKLQGGLGNQMFQYAAARSFSNAKKISLDFSFLNKNNQSSESFTARPYELAIFSKLKARPSNKYFIKLIQSKRLIAKQLAPRFKLMTDGNIHDFKAIIPKNIYLDGYFQNPSIFQEIRKTLLDEFTFPTLENKESETALKIINSKNSVAIHIRRGDYTKPAINNFHGILSMEYYLNSIKIMKSKVEDPFFYIFSDDPAWCKENFSFIKNKEIMSGVHPNWVDMYLMSKCKHQIIANSSFSWWGAWLNSNDKKIVIAPKQWFNIQNTEIIPKEWITL